MSLLLVFSPNFLVKVYACCYTAVHCCAAESDEPHISAALDRLNNTVYAGCHSGCPLLLVVMYEWIYKHRGVITINQYTINILQIHVITAHIEDEHLLYCCATSHSSRCIPENNCSYQISTAVNRTLSPVTGVLACEHLRLLVYEFTPGASIIRGSALDLQEQHRVQHTDRAP